MTDENGSIAIHSRRCVLAFLLVGSILLAAGSTLMLAGWSREETIFSLLPFTEPLLALSGMLFFGFCSVTLLFAATRSRPVISFGPSGIGWDFLCNRGSIKWDEIAHIVIFDFGADRMLGIVPRDTTSFMANRSWFALRSIRSNVRQGMPPLSFSQTTLDADFSKLARDMGDQYGIPVSIRTRLGRGNSAGRFLGVYLIAVIPFAVLSLLLVTSVPLLSHIEIQVMILSLGGTVFWHLFEGPNKNTLLNGEEAIHDDRHRPTGVARIGSEIVRFFRNHKRHLSVWMGAMLVLCVLSYGQAASIRIREQSAVTSLKAIAAAEEMFRLSGIKDQDGDGRSDFGTLRELAGLDPVSGTGQTVIDPFIDGSLGVGTGLKDGYHYDVYLWEGDLKEKISWAQKDGFLAMAWPVDGAYSGNRHTYPRSFYIGPPGTLHADVLLHGKPNPWCIVFGGCGWPEVQTDEPYPFKRKQAQ